MKATVRRAFYATILAIILILAGCPNSLVSKSDQGATSPFSSVVNKSIILKDASGAILGYVTSVDAYEINIFTSKNYFVRLNWHGGMVLLGAFYTADNGMGTAFLVSSVTSPPFDITTCVGGQPYIAAATDSFGFAVPDLTITGYQSYSSGVSIINYVGTIYPGNAAYPLQTASLADIGLPSSIALPMQLLFQ